MGTSAIKHTQLSNRLLDLDALRGFAVVLVMLFHFFPTSLQNGWVGVDIFFVLSGYFCARLMEVQHAKSFIFRRIARLYLPLFAMLLIFILLLCIIYTDIGSLKSIMKAAFFSITGGSNLYFFFSEDYFNPTKGNPLLHTWSLGVEIQFYLVCSIYLYINEKSPHMRKYIDIFMLVLSVIMLYISRYYLDTWFYFLHARLFEFVIGVIAYRYRSYKINNSFIYYLLACSMCLLQVF